MAAQGYVQAQERFYEMDFRRHTTAGRLSELFGTDTLETDEFVRTLGLAARGRAGAARCSSRRPARRWTRTPRASTPTSRTAARRRSPCSTPCSASAGLDYRPEPWTAVDSLAWLKAMAWDLQAATWTTRSTARWRP